MNPITFLISLEILSATDAESESEPFRFSVNNIHIKNGSIDFYDGPKKTRHEIRDLNISMPLLSALPDDINDFVHPVFQATNQ